MPVQTQMELARIHQDLTERRQTGEVLSLNAYLNEKFTDFSSDAPNEAFEKYLFKMGIMDPGKMTTKQFLSFPDDSFTFMLSELILEMFVEGMEEAFPISDLLAVDVDTTQTQITLPVFIYDRKKKMVGRDKVVPMGVQFDEDNVKVEGKTVQTGKHGKALKLPYEILRDTPIELLAKYYIGFGRELGQELFAYLLDVMLNGDGGMTPQGKASTPIADGVAVIGVEDPANGIVFRDINRASIRLSKRGKKPESLIVDEFESYDILDLPQYSERKVGVVDSPIQIKGQYKTPDTFYFSNDEIGAKSALVFSKDNCTGKFTRQSTLVETEKIKSRQIEAWYISTEFGFMNFFHDARCKIDGTIDFASNGFPTWMLPKVKK
jgi:hypothetical protein